MALISFAFTAKLICAFGFAYAYCWISDAVAHLSVSILCLFMHSPWHRYFGPVRTRDFHIQAECIFMFEPLHQNTNNLHMSLLGITWYCLHTNR